MNRTTAIIAGLILILLLLVIAQAMNNAPSNTQTLPSPDLYNQDNLNDSTLTSPSPIISDIPTLELSVSPVPSLTPIP